LIRGLWINGEKKCDNATSLPIFLNKMSILDNILKLFSPYENMAYDYEEKSYISYVVFGLGFLIIVAIIVIPIYFIFFN